MTLRGLCESTAPRSGLYINDHEAVKLRRFEQLTTEDEATITEVWDKIQERASNRFESDLRTRMAGWISGKGIMSNAVSGYYKEPQELIAASTDRRGVYIEISRYDNIALNLVSVDLWLQASGAVTIKIHDLNTGAEIFTQDFTGLVGYNSFRIDRNFSTASGTKRFGITYTSQATMSARVHGSILDSGCDCSCDCDNINVRGMSIPAASQMVKANAVFGSESYGLIVNFNLVCSIANFLCTNLDDLKMAWFDLLAIEFLKEAQHSDRLNQFTMAYDKGVIDGLLNGTQTAPGGYYAIYYASLDDFIQNAKPDFDGICFTCDHPVTNVTFLP